VVVVATGELLVVRDLPAFRGKGVEDRTRPALTLRTALPRENVGRRQLARDPNRATPTVTPQPKTRIRWSLTTATATATVATPQNGYMRERRRDRRC
jgi:hypothetical protein